MNTLEWLKYIGLVDAAGEAVAPPVEETGQALWVAGQRVTADDVLRLCQQRQDFKTSLMKEVRAHCHTQQLLRRYEHDGRYDATQDVFFVTRKGYEALDEIERQGA